MKTNCFVILFSLLISPIFFLGQSVLPGFMAPDTVCVNTPVNITNTSSGASTYYWNFCVANSATNPMGTNLGNFGFTLSVFIDYAKDGNNYYAFVTNNMPGKLVRLDFGSSLLNTPVAHDFGNLGGVIPDLCEGIQLVKNEDRWYAIIVGGSPVGRIVKVDFGASLSNNTPVATNWGNIGNIAYPVDLHLFQNGNNWYGLTINAQTSTITRFDFTNSFSNTPTGVNLGNIGGLNYPTGIYAISKNNNWYAFVTNAGSGYGSSTNASLTRLDFGNSLLNTPTGANLGNPGNTLSSARDITIYQSCNEIFGFVVNYSASNDIVRLNFNNDLTSVPTAVSIGNTGSLNFPHCISKLFRVENDLYSFVANVNNNTITLLKFQGCNGSAMTNSMLQSPPPVIYNAPGIYNINLTVDDGLPTQSAFCKQVVVLASPTHSPTQNFSVCSGGKIKIGSPVKSAKYQWNTGETSDSIVVNAEGTYWVESDRYGCSVRDSFVISYSHIPLDFVHQQNMCSDKTIQFASNLSGMQSYLWNFGNGQTNNLSQTPSATYFDYGAYTVKLNVRYGNGCRDSIAKTILVENNFDASVVLNNDSTVCLDDSILLKTVSSLFNYCWRASNGIAPGLVNAYVKPNVPTTYVLTSQIGGDNLVANGDFSSGNTGFTSDYNYINSNNTVGQYWIGSSANTWNPAFANCGDHSSGSGNMMMVSASSASSSKVWSQTLSVTPNTDYNFSFWMTSLSTLNPAGIHFSINNADLGNSDVGNSNCQWKQFSSTWNSGNNSSATITILNNNALSKNDFAIDDIFFGQVKTKTDSVTINVVGLCDSVKINGSDKVCSSSDTLTYSIYKSPNCTQQYILQVDDAFARIVSQTSTTIRLLFKQNGTTTIKVGYGNNCKIVVDSLNVNIKFSPTSINFGPDVITCRDTSLALNAGDGFVSYNWQDGSKDSMLIVKSPGDYNIIAQNFCGAQLKDTFRLIRSLITPFTVSPLSAAVCKGDSVLFKASGGTSYSWSPSGNFNQPVSSSTKALIDASQNFTVFISDSSCKRDTTVIIPVIATPAANISVYKSNDVNCGNDSAVLIANGGVSYSWSPNLFISRNNGNKITVKPYQNITYAVRGKDELGCYGQDSVTVFFFKEGNQKLFMPTAFTPNGDGLNDIIKPTFIGPAANYDFRIYNRWGQLMFRSKTTGVGWDGTFNGIVQKADVYVFYITAEGGCNGRFEQKGTFALIR